MNQAEKIKIYDKNVKVGINDIENREELLISYRSGDIYIPKIEDTEALLMVVEEFADCITEKRPSLTDGESGLRVLKILEAAERSIKADGANVRIQNEGNINYGILSRVA